MRIKVLIITILAIIYSCNNEKSVNSERSLTKMTKEAISITEGYITDQLKDSRKSINNIGLITIENKEKRYIIDPKEVYTGLIDDDQITDAIITIISFKGQDYYMTEHLILINTEGRLRLIRSFEKDMKILRLNDRIITAEIHTKPRTSPLYNCESCRAILTYKYSNGDLVKTE